MCFTWHIFISSVFISNQKLAKSLKKETWDYLNLDSLFVSRVLPSHLSECAVILSVPDSWLIIHVETRTCKLIIQTIQMFSTMQTDLWLSQTNSLRSKELIACWQIYTRVPFESEKRQSIQAIFNLIKVYFDLKMSARDCWRLPVHILFPDSGGIWMPGLCIQSIQFFQS